MRAFLCALLLLLFRADSRASVINLSSADNALDAIAKSGVDGVGFVLFSDALVDGALAASFFRVAERLRGRAAFFEAHSSLASALGVGEAAGAGACVARIIKGSPAVLLRSISEAKEAPASAVATVVDDPSALSPADSKLLGWVLQHRWPPLVKLTDQNYAAITADGRPVVILFKAEDGSDKTRAASFAVDTISDSLTTPLPPASLAKFLFATVSISDAKLLALRYVGTETAFIVFDNAGKRYWSDNTVFELEDLETLLMEIVDLKIPARTMPGVKRPPPQYFDKKYFVVGTSMLLVFAPLLFWWRLRRGGKPNSSTSPPTKKSPSERRVESAPHEPSPRVSLGNNDDTSPVGGFTEGFSRSASKLRSRPGSPRTPAIPSKRV